MGVGVSTAEKLPGSTSFASAAELREVLTDMLETIERDSEVGRRLRSAHISYRYAFSDFGVSLDISSSDDPDHCVRWSFSETRPDTPVLTLEMTSEVANSYLQGRESLAIAVARGRIHLSRAEAKTALNLLPISREISQCYRQVLERSHPHLLIT